MKISHLDDMVSVHDDLGGLLIAADDKLSKIHRPTDASQHHWIHHLAEQREQREQRERCGVKSVKAQPFKRATLAQFAMQGIKAGTAEGETGACAARWERILPRCLRHSRPAADLGRTQVTIRSPFYREISMQVRPFKSAALMASIKAVSERSCPSGSASVTVATMESCRSGWMARIRTWAGHVQRRCHPNTKHSHLRSTITAFHRSLCRSSICSCPACETSSLRLDWNAPWLGMS